MTKAYNLYDHLWQSMQISCVYCFAKFWTMWKTPESISYLASLGTVFISDFLCTRQQAVNFRQAMKILCLCMSGFTYGSGTRIPLLNAANIRAILRHYKIPASLLFWYTWLSASSKCLLTNSVLRVEFFISLRYTFCAVKGKQS